MTIPDCRQPQQLPDGDRVHEQLRGGGGDSVHVPATPLTRTMPGQGRNTIYTSHILQYSILYTAVGKGQGWAPGPCVCYHAHPDHARTGV